MLRTYGTIAAGIVAIVALLIILWLLMRGRGGAPAPVEADTEAYLQDIHGFTAQASYKLGTKPTMLGRVAGKESDQLEYIVIPESTIGRRHSLIEYKDFSYWIIDQGSINGTFVNDQPVSGEVRLKHGDRIRLHKYEFEFVMPDMVDAGMTVVSQTVMAANPAVMPKAPEAESTRLKSTPAIAEETLESELLRDVEGDMDLDFDLTSGLGGDEDDIPGAGEQEDVTAIRPRPDHLDQRHKASSEEETYIPGGQGRPASQPAARVRPEDKFDSEDETLMPGEFEFPDEEDATIRKDNDISLDNFIDLEDLDDDKK